MSDNLNDYEQIEDNEELLNDTELAVGTTATASGEIDSNISWILYDDGRLILETIDKNNTGVMNSHPWTDYKDQIKSVSIGTGITNVCVSAFTDCTYLTTVELSKDVTIIGAWAFQECTSLTTINLPNKLTSIISGAFMGCTSLSTIETSENLTFIGGLAFSGCSNLNSILLYNSIKIIGGDAFAGCNNLVITFLGTEEQKATIDIKDTTEHPWEYKYFDINLQDISQSCEIGEGAFQNHNEIYSMNIPNTVVQIGKNTFKGCERLSTISLPFIGPIQNSTETFVYIFNNDDKVLPSNLSQVTITGDITSIQDNAFKDTKQLSVINLPSSITDIGANAFNNSGIINFTLPKNVVSLGNGVFQNNQSSLLSFTWYTTNHVWNSGYEANSFFDAEFIADVENKDIIGYPYIKADRIEGEICYGTEPLAMQEGNDYDSLTAVLYETTSRDKIIGFAPILSHLFAPENIKNYQGSCGNNLTYFIEPLEDNTKIYKIKISGTGDMFDYTETFTPPWQNLKERIQEIEVSNNVTSIGSYAFYDYSNLTQIILPSTIKRINEYAFYNCNQAHFKDTLADNQDDMLRLYALKTIGNNAFEFCEQLKTFDCEGVSGCLEEVGDTIFKDCSALITVKFPAKNILLGYNIFYNCAKIENISLPVSSDVGGANNIESLEENYTKYNIGFLFGCEDDIQEEKFFSYRWLLPYNRSGHFQFVGGHYESYPTFKIPRSLQNIDINYTANNGVIPVGYLYHGEVYVGSDELNNWTTVSFGKNIVGAFYFDDDSSLTEKKDWGRFLGVISDNIQAYNIRPQDFDYEDFAYAEVKYPIPSSIGVYDSTYYVFYQKNYTKITSLENFSGIGYGSKVSIEELDLTQTTISNVRLGNYKDLILLRLPKTTQFFNSVGSGIHEINAEGAIITKISEYAFRGNTKLESIICKFRINEIPDSAFRECSSLRAIGEIEGTQIVIGVQAFDNCSALTTLSFTNNSTISNIGKYAFRNCNVLTSVFPCAYTGLTVDDYGFYGCEQIAFKYLEQEDTVAVNAVGLYGFYSCKALQTAIIKNSLTTMNNYAFQNCNHLSSLIFESSSSIQSIGEYAFSSCILKDVRVPVSVQTIGNGAFQNYQGVWIELPFIGSSNSATLQQSVLAYIFGKTASSSLSENSEYQLGCYTGVYYFYSMPPYLTEVYISNSNTVPDYAFYNWKSDTTKTKSPRQANLEHTYFKILPETVGEYAYDNTGGTSGIENYPEVLPWEEGIRTGKSRLIRAKGSTLSLENDENRCLYLSYDKEYLWKLILYGKQYDVYITDNNTYAEQYSYLPILYVPNHTGIEKGQHIELQGENTYIIDSLQQFNHVGKTYYRQSKGVLNGKISYYSVSSGTLTYSVDTEKYTIDTELQNALTSQPIEFSTGNVYDSELQKGMISIVADTVVVTLNDGVNPKIFEFGETIAVKKAMVNQATLTEDLLNAIHEDSQFVVDNSNQLQTVTAIDDFYNMTFTPGFGTNTTGYKETQITLADKMLILPNNLRNNEVVVVVNTKGKITIDGNLGEEKKKGKLEEHLLSLIVPYQTYFTLEGTDYIITQVDFLNKTIVFENKEEGSGYVIDNQVTFEHEILLKDYMSLSTDEGFDITDLHLTLNYINVFEIESIKVYNTKGLEDVFALEEGEVLYTITCKEVVNPTNYEVNSRDLEKEAVIERYSTILTVKTLDGETPQHLLVAPNTAYFIYSNNVKTPAYYFQSLQKEEIQVFYQKELVEGAINMNCGSGLFEAKYNGNIATCTWSLQELYYDDYIEIDSITNHYSPNLFYNYHLFKENTHYKLTITITTQDKLIITKDINIQVGQYEPLLDFVGITLEKDCEKQAIKINLSNVELKIKGVEDLGYKLCPRSWIASDKAPYIVKGLYIIRENLDNSEDNAVVAQVEGFPYYVYDYSFQREDHYRYSVLPIYCDMNHPDIILRGVPCVIEPEIIFNSKVISLIGTEMDLREHTQENEALVNNFMTDAAPFTKWYFKYNTEARNVNIVTDKTVYETILPYATVNYTARNYKSGTITAFLGAFHKDDILSDWTYKDSIRLQNKLQQFANNGKIKMLRDEIGNVIPVDITLQSFEYNSQSKPTTITVSFEWNQIASEKNLTVYESNYDY